LTSLSKASIIVTSFTALGLCISALSNAAVAAQFGATKQMDIYLAATSLPQFLAGIFAFSLSITFMPVFSHYTSHDHEETWLIVSSFLNIMIILRASISLLAMIFSSQILHLLVPGFGEGEIAETSTLFRWLSPITIFIIINELLASIYYSYGSFRNTVSKQNNFSADNINFCNCLCKIA